MKKLLLSALACLAALGAYAQDDDKTLQKELGHTNDQYVSMGEGIGLGEDGTLGVAVRFTAKQLQQYKGGKIVGMMVGAGDGCKTDQPVRIFLKKRDLFSESLIEQNDLIAWEQGPQYYGLLSPILFDTPWDIPDNIREDIYVGLYSDVKGGQNVIGVSMNNQTASERTVFLAESFEGDKAPSNWDDILSIPELSAMPNNAILRLLIELPAENYRNVVVFKNGFMPNICIANDHNTGYFLLKNDGDKTVKDFDLAITHGDNTINQHFSIEGEGLLSNKSSEGPQPLPIYISDTGHYVIEITRINGEENTATDKKSVEFDIVAVPASVAVEHVRRPVYEQYCSESDYNTGVHTDLYIKPFINAHKNGITFLPHHASDKFLQNPVDVPAIVEGKQDFMTLSDADRWAIILCGGASNVIMPSCTIDRTIQMAKVNLNVAIANTPMGNGTIVPKAAEICFADAVKVPTFASVALENNYDAATNMINVKASGSIADLLPEGEKAKLSLFLIEESIETDSQEFPESEQYAQMYPDGKFTHPRVIRQNITDDFWGDELEPGQDFVKTYSFELENPRWNVDHMKVIALIQRPETNEFLHHDILNSAEEPLTETYEEPASINSVAIDRTEKGGIYDLQGRKLNVPAKGINIINGKKVLVK